MSDQTTIEVVLASESTIGAPIVETVTVIGTVPVGPRGPAGPPGEPGPPGSAPQAYVHEQGTPSDVWEITHNLGYQPNFSVTDSGGTNVEAAGVWLDDDHMEIHFNNPCGGTARLT